MTRLTNERKLEMLCDIIEAFEDMLDKYGIIIPNNEKEEEGVENPCNIYGTDYGNLETEIGDILYNYGLLDYEDAMEDDLK